METTTGQEVAYAMYFAIGTVSAIFFLYWFFLAAEEGQPTPAARLYVWFMRAFWSRYFMFGADDEDDDPAHIAGAQQPLRVDTTGIATPQTSHNSAVVCCEEVVALTTEWNKHNERNGIPVRYTVDAVYARIDMTIRVQHAKKADGTPKIGETDLIKHGMGIQPGTGNVLYGFAKAAIKAERERRQAADLVAKYPPLDPDYQATREWIEA